MIKWHYSILKNIADFGDQTFRAVTNQKDYSNNLIGGQEIEAA